VPARRYGKSRLVAMSLGSEECRVMGSGLSLVCRSIMAECCVQRSDDTHVAAVLNCGLYRNSTHRVIAV